MAKTISTILNLKNNMSQGLLKVNKDLKGMSKEAKAATLQVKHMADNFQKKINGMVSSASKLIKAGAGIAGAFALKTGLSEAMDLEGFRTQLETATKDTRRAAEVMKYAIDLANKTPFEGGELVSAASSLEMFGLKSERWLPVLGDAAAGVNRSMADIQSGFIKAATTGDFASLRDTLGVTKEMVDEYAKANLGGSFLNSKGQITDAAKLQDALEALLNDRYAGGMEKLAKTTRGVWSTITGVTKNSLARIVGMQNDGTVKSGSLLDYIREKATVFADLLQKWQNDGTLDKIANGAAAGFQKVVESLSKVAKFAAENKDTILGIVAAFGGFMAGSKIAAGIKSIVDGFNTLKNILFVTSKGALAFSPAGWIILGITALVTVFVTAYRKSETFRDKVNALWAKFKEFAAGLKAQVVPKLNELYGWFQQHILPVVGNFINLIKTAWTALQPFVAWLAEKLGPVFERIFGRMKTYASDFFSGMKTYIEGMMSMFNGLITFLTGVFEGDWTKAWEGIKEIFSGAWTALGGMVKAPINLIIDGLNYLIRGFNEFANFKMPEWVPEGLGGGKTIGLAIPEIPHFALGTQFFGGGLARINERGGEIVNLPNGSKVIPADKSRVGGNVTVNVTVQGNLIGNREYADYIGGVIMRKVQTALINS